MNFREFVEPYIVNVLNYKSVNPDAIIKKLTYKKDGLDLKLDYDDDSFTFSYLNNKLYKDKAWKPHNDITMDNLKYVMDDLKELKEKGIKRETVAGRTGFVTCNNTRKNVITFWKCKHEFMVTCLEYMLNNKLITNDYLYLGDNNAMTVSQLIGGSAFSPPDDSEARALHTMQGQEKNKALKDMGVTSPERPQGLNPGQKWWALNSEDVKTHHPKQ